VTHNCRFSFWRVSLHDRPSSASSPWELKGTVTLSHSQGCKLSNWRIESECPVRRPSIISKHLSNLARSQPPSASPVLLYNALHVYFLAHLITASKIPWSQPLGASPNSLNYSLQVYTIMTSKVEISKLPWSWPPSVSPNWLDHCLQIHTIMAGKWISRVTWSLPRSECLSSLHYQFQVHLEFLWSPACS
jgi:hypothetical protein